MDGVDSQDSAPEKGRQLSRARARKKKKRRPGRTERRRQPIEKWRGRRTRAKHEHFRQRTASNTRRFPDIRPRCRSPLSVSRKLIPYHCTPDVDVNASYFQMIPGLSPKNLRQRNHIKREDGKKVSYGGESSKMDLTMDLNAFLPFLKYFPAFLDFFFQKIKSKATSTMFVDNNTS